MVKKLSVVTFLICLAAVPALAQDDDFPRIETTLGYANLAFPNFDDGETGHHSGFAMFNGLNLTRWLGIENYTGVYGMGSGVTLISNIVGGKLMARSERVVPYFVAGLGGGFFTSNSAYGSSFSTRLGGGVDVPLNDSMSMKFDFSRMSFHSGGWISDLNFVTGITFNIAN
jgi:hypothetical protein